MRGDHVAILSNAVLSQEQDALCKFQRAMSETVHSAPACKSDAQQPEQAGQRGWLGGGTGVAVTLPTPPAVENVARLPPPALHAVAPALISPARRSRNVTCASTRAESE